GEGTIGFRPRRRRDAIGDFRLDEKHDARGERWSEGLVDERGGDGVGDVADHLEMRNAERGRRNNHSLPIEAQRVSVNDGQSICSAFRVPRSEFGCQSAIFFYRDHAQPAGEQFVGEGSRPRPDLDHDVVGGGLERVGDALQDVPVGEKVLAEPLVRNHTLRITTVRSSAGGAPPVKPARSACTDSRISRAGRSFKRATWPSTRSSPKRSALPPPPPPPPPPSASATPSVKRQTIASRRAQVSTASAPGAVARPSGGRVASSRTASPVRVDTRNACGCPAFAKVIRPPFGSTTA